jgi:FAD:protein FMN transferase
VLSVMRTHQFESMGTTVALTGPATLGFEAAARRVERTFRALDARFSRFRPETELSTVNAGSGQWRAVSPEFAEVLCIALEGARATGGLFDPTILPALVAAGYDRDFAELLPGSVRPKTPPAPCGTWPDVELRGMEVRIPDGMLLDFGGVAKGWAVDQAVERALVELPWAMVDAGGDLRVAGHPPEKGLEIAVEDPWDRASEVMRLQLGGGAVATSSLPSRAWGPDLHQLIDPRTLRPARTGVVQATAWAATCADAEIRAKWLLLGGPGVLDHVHGMVVMEDGWLVTNLVPASESCDLAPTDGHEKSELKEGVR